MFYNIVMKKINSNTKLLSEADGGASFAMLMVGYILISFVVQGVLQKFIDPKSATYIFINSLLSPLTILLILVYQAKLKGYGFNIASVNKFKIHNVFLSLLLSLAMFLGLGFVNIVLAELLAKLGVNIASPVIPTNNFTEFLLMLVGLAVLPAIFEELFFRGILLNSLSEQKNMSKIITVSLYFALYHCSVTQFAYQFIYGVLLTVLAIYSKSIIPCMITHFMNNFLVLLFTYLKISIDLTNLLVIGIGLVFLVSFIILMHNGLSKQKNTSGQNMGQKAFYLPYGLFAIIICLSVMVSLLLV